MGTIFHAQCDRWSVEDLLAEFWRVGLTGSALDRISTELGAMGMGEPEGRLGWSAVVRVYRWPIGQ